MLSRSLDVTSTNRDNALACLPCTHGPIQKNSCALPRTPYMLARMKPSPLIRPSPPTWLSVHADSLYEGVAIALEFARIVSGSIRYQLFLPGSLLS